MIVNVSGMYMVVYNDINVIHSYIHLHKPM